MKRLTIPIVVKDVKQLTFSSTIGKNKIVQLLWNYQQFLIKLYLYLPYHQNILLSGNYPREMKTHVYKKDTHKNVLPVSFKIAKNWKPPKHLSRGK